MKITIQNSDLFVPLEPLVNIFSGKMKIKLDRREIELVFPPKKPVVKNTSAR